MAMEHSVIRCGRKRSKFFFFSVRALTGVLVLIVFGNGFAGGNAPAGDHIADAISPQLEQQVALPALPFDHILPYDEMTALLRGWAAARPNIIEIESIGVTPEGRDLWFLTLTNRATGPAAEKPALLVDGNMHALEWTGGVAALDFIWRLLSDYGRDVRVTRLLDTRCLYVLPRVSPDGVETTLREGRIVRSVSRPSQGDVSAPGLHMRDIDGDGRIVFMRFRDPNGPWKLHPEEPRLLIARRPDETGGDYWRVVPEGLIEGFDGETIKVLPALEGIDFGVHFPDDRTNMPQKERSSPDAKLVPEIAAYVDAIMSRPNIVAYVTCHSFGGAVLMPPVNTSERMPMDDRHIYAALAAKATELTGYKAMSYLDLRAGRMLDMHIPTEIGWLYNIRGIFSFITEFWNPLKAAGVSIEGVMSRWLGGFHPVEHEMQLLHWSDAELAGRGFVSWHIFDHPQLGPVEIGGWDKVHYWYNVPFDRLENEVAPHSDWLIYLALAMPRLEVRSFLAKPEKEGLWNVRLVIENTGWMATYGSQKAIDNQTVKGIVARLELRNNAQIIKGDLCRSIGHLAGRTEQRSTVTWWGYNPGTPDRAVVDWLIAAPRDAKISVKVEYDRAGTARANLHLE